MAVNRPECRSTNACGSATIAFESCVCCVWCFAHNFNAQFLYSRWLAGRVVAFAGHRPWCLSTDLNAVPRALAVQVQLRLKVVCVVFGVSPITSMLGFSTVAGWLAVLLGVLGT